MPTTVRFFAAASEAPEVMPDLDAADAVTVDLVSATVEASADDDGVIALSPPRSPPPSPPPPPEAGACGTHGTPSPLAAHRCMVRLAEGVLLHYSLETRELNVTIECECDVCADGITLAFATEAGRVAGAVAIVSDGGTEAVVCEDNPNYATCDFFCPLDGSLSGQTWRRSRRTAQRAAGSARRAPRWRPPCRCSI